MLSASLGKTTVEQTVVLHKIVNTVTLLGQSSPLGRMNVDGWMTQATATRKIRGIIREKAATAIMGTVDGRMIPSLQPAVIEKPQAEKGPDRNVMAFSQSKFRTRNLQAVAKHMVRTRLARLLSALGEELHQDVGTMMTSKPPLTNTVEMLCKKKLLGTMSQQTTSDLMVPRMHPKSQNLKLEIGKTLIQRKTGTGSRMLQSQEEGRHPEGGMRQKEDKAMGRLAR